MVLEARKCDAYRSQLLEKRASKVGCMVHAVEAKTKAFECQNAFHRGGLPAGFYGCVVVSV